MRAPTGLTAIMSLPLLLGACTMQRMGKNLDAHVAEQKGEFQDILGSLQTARPKSISWDKAYKQMVRDNLSLRQSRQQLEDSKKQKTRQWLRLVPRPTSYVSVGSSISELSNLGSDDLNASLFANFNIPNPFEFYGALYGASLQKQNAIWSHELDQRRAYTELYSAFIEGESIDQAAAVYNRRMDSLMENRSGDVSKLLRNAAFELKVLESRRLYHRQSVNRLLNTPGANWRLDAPPPDISYAGKYGRLAVGENFGKLALNLQAIQIEGAILRVRQVQFQQWPSVNFGLSTPPLYSTNSSTNFSSDSLQLFSGAYKTFDLSDIGGQESIQDAKTRLTFTREQLRLRAENEASRILQLGRAYGALLNEKKSLQRESDRLTRPGSIEPEIVMMDLEKRSELEIQLIENRRQIREMDLQFLIWDETFWN